MPQTLFELLTPEARALLRHAEAVLASAAVDGYVVGGTLRDALLGLTAPEVDLAVDGDALALADAIAERAGGVSVALDTVRGIARVVNMAHEASQPHLDLIRLQGGSLDADLRRRDFTINAMALPMEAATAADWRERIVDPLGGVQDLAERRLRLASPSALADDPARLLRAVRIASHRGMAMAPELEAALTADGPLMARVAGDRLRDELLLLLEAPDPTGALHELDRLGLLMQLIPEMKPMRGCEQPAEHYWDVLEHTLQAVGFAHRLLAHDGLDPEVLEIVPWDDSLAARFAAPFAHGHSRATFVKLACLFHDIAKPATKSIEPTGRVRFFGHAELGAEMLEQIMARLRFSGKAIRHVALMVTEHLRPTQMAPARQPPSRRAIWRFHRDLGDAAVDTLYLSLADHLAARGPRFEFTRWQRHATICTSVLRNELRQSVARKPRLVNGHDLMQRFRLMPGPALGRLLEAVEEAAGAGEITSREEAFVLAGKLLAANHAAHPGRKS